MEFQLGHLIRNFFYPDGVTPLPWQMLCVLVMLCILNDMNVTMLFSFAPKMIKNFGISEIDTGYYAGWLSSSLYIGILSCTFFWGYLGDIKGKKLSIIVSTLGHALATLAFGFSYNYYWALVTRSLQGCFFGVIHVSKSILYDELDDTNLAFGMTILTASGVLGYMFGPSLAGCLVFPAEQYPKVFLKDSIFETFPVLLPHIVVSACLSIGIILSVIYLPGNKNSNMDECTSILEDDIEKCRRHTNDDKLDKKGKTFECRKGKKQSQEHIPLLQNDLRRSSNEGEYFSLSGNASDDSKCNKMEQGPGRIFLKDKLLSLRIMRVISVKDCLLSCILYGIYGFASIASNELFPLLASTSVEYNGMGYTPAEIGITLLVASILLIVVQIPILRKIIDLIGARKTFISSAFLQVAFISFIPCVGLIRNKTVQLPVLCTHMFFLRLCVSGSFLSVTILINNSIGQDLNGTANGFGFTLTALGRLISPSIFGAMYSWSLTNVKGIESNKHALGYPFNQFFSFYMLAIVLVFIGIIGTQVSTSLDFKKVALVIEES